MKYFIPFILIIAFSCKKQDNPTSDLSEKIYLQKVKAQLKTGLTAISPSALDYSKAIRIGQTSGQGNVFFKIPAMANSSSAINGFVLLQTDLSGTILSGKYIEVSKDNTSHSFAFSGEITIRDLKGMIEKRTRFINGMSQQADDPGLAQSTAPVVPSCSNCLPPVEVVGYISSNGTVSLANYMLIQSILYAAGGSGGTDAYSGYYIPVGPNSGGNGGGGDMTWGGGGLPPDALEFESDYVEAQPTIDLEKYFKCFDNVPNEGASYIIRLNTDIPSNSNPSAMFGFRGVGHVFLTISKANEEQFVTQTFGFYMEQPLSPLDPFSPVTSRMINNGGREVNASIQMNMTQAQFDTVRSKALSFAHNTYDLNSYNCANYALDVFNSIRTNPITVKSCVIDIPAVNALPPVQETIYKSPQTLFMKLKEMKDAGGAEAGRIKIDQTHDTKARQSTGACE